MKSLPQIAQQITNSNVLLRVDYNVPLKDSVIQDTTRIDESLQSINFILQQKPQRLIIMSHMGRPKNQDPNLSLKQILPYLQQKLPDSKINFVNNYDKKEIEQFKNGEIVLLENTRYFLEEEYKLPQLQYEQYKQKLQHNQNIDRINILTKESMDLKTIKFKIFLSQLGDIFVNDAFSVSHRAHSSIVVNCKINCSGFLLQKELDAYKMLDEKLTKPFVVIIGGAKIVDKIQLIFNLLDKCNEMIIGGGMAFTFLKVIHNMNIGNSLFDEKGSKLVNDIMKKAQEKNVKIHLPLDFVAGKEFKNDTELKQFDGLQIDNGYIGMDIGPKTIQLNHQVLMNAGLIVMNGPQGVFEFDNFSKGSIEIINSILKSTQENKAKSICGGGDTVSLLNLVPESKKIITHVSTGGGATLELLEGKKLPGIQNLQ